MSSLFAKVLEWFGLEPHHDHGVSYVVVHKGDSLYNIAVDITGNGSRWEELEASNPDMHFTKDTVIHPGDKIILPAEWTKDAD